MKDDEILHFLKANEQSLPILLFVFFILFVLPLLYFYRKTKKVTSRQSTRPKGDPQKFASDLVESSDRTEALQDLITNTKYLKEDEDLIFCMDLDFFQKNVDELKEAFPKNTLHGIAVKANPATGFLKYSQELGLGAEVASLVELKQAIRCGFSPEKIVFDSPAKTRNEIVHALKLGVTLNVDNLQELETVRGVLAELKEKSGSLVGMRINTQHGAGDIQATSTATLTSKFGVAIRRHREEIIRSFAKYEWLNGVHAHGGSQGCSLQLLVEGARILMDLVQEINQVREENGYPKLCFVDIGGGIPTDYSSVRPSNLFQRYAQMLRKEVPELFQSQHRVITEIGRALVVNAGWSIARVKYVKATGASDKNANQRYTIAITDYGADCDVRNSYMPGVWHRRVNVYRPNGQLKDTRHLQLTDIVGPLCFSGDLLVKGRRLPSITKGDLVMIHNTGGYTLAMWSRYNSRCAPMMVGYTAINKSFKWQVLKSKEKQERVLEFWD
ncbi:decarboxylase-related [Anaeramoeba flamelloides]|uniref:Decarboxylase-related n=1 Tax=Anaeramoeba flamelloides TaxID=1746091 RepID=A0AAV7Z0L1_9EUKA|nr:decarboxylase-related [Anaeramoeba flamelloides]